MTTPRKNVTLPREVYDRLAATGTTQDTFGQVISRLLDEHEERARIVSWAVELVRKRMDELYGSFSTWGESEAAMEEMISGIPCADIRNAAREYLEQLREDQLAWEDECGYLLFAASEDGMIADQPDYNRPSRIIIDDQVSEIESFDPNGW